MIPSLGDRQWKASTSCNQTASPPRKSENRTQQTLDLPPLKWAHIKTPLHPQPGLNPLSKTSWFSHLPEVQVGGVCTHAQTHLHVVQAMPLQGQHCYYWLWLAPKKNQTSYTIVLYIIGNVPQKPQKLSLIEDFHLLASRCLPCGCSSNISPGHPGHQWRLWTPSSRRRCHGDSRPPTMRYMGHPCRCLEERLVQSGLWGELVLSLELVRVLAAFFQQFSVDLCWWRCHTNC